MITKLQNEMRKHHIDYYIIPTSDEHQSEIIGDFYQFRRYLSGFTGSAGTLIVGLHGAWLWTDGRYFLQASQQLDPRITLMKARMPGVPSINEFLISRLTPQTVLGFDGTTMAPGFILTLMDELSFDLNYKEVDLSAFWIDRPERSHQPVVLYDKKYHGRDCIDKLEELRDFMKTNSCDHHLLSALDDIAWIFNIRGSDIPESPIALAFAIISMDDATLYLQDGTYDQKIIDHFNAINVTIKSYEDVYDDVSSLEGTLLLDTNTINMSLYDAIQCDIIDEANPSQYFKCIKNETEIKCTKNAHLKDGIAMTRFMHHLKTTIKDDKEATEITIENKLETFRQAQPLYMGPSFTTICAYKDNASIIHYHTTPERFSHVEASHLLMIDSGGQYLDGTTDITRTFVLGEITDEERTAFTLVLKGFLRLQNAIFTDDTVSNALDYIAREPLTSRYLDYRHSTGHGVGHYLNVHEMPVMISSRLSQAMVLEPGMITSDEPGVYIDGQYGVRHENELLVVEAGQSDYGRFLTFEPLTLCPIDLDGIDVNLLDDKEIEWLNHYHQQIYDLLHQYLSDLDEWLRYVTRPIIR